MQDTNNLENISIGRNFKKYKKYECKIEKICFLSLLIEYNSQRIIFLWKKRFIPQAESNPGPPESTKIMSKITNLMRFSINYQNVMKSM